MYLAGGIGGKCVYFIFWKQKSSSRTFDYLATWEKEERGFELLVLWEMRVVVQSHGRGPSNVAASGISGKMAGKCFSVEPEIAASDVCFEAISSPGFQDSPLPPVFMYACSVAQLCPTL